MSNFIERSIERHQAICRQIKDKLLTVVIMEGVSGAGKSSFISELEARKHTKTKILAFDYEDVVASPASNVFKDKMENPAIAETYTVMLKTCFEEDFSRAVSDSKVGGLIVCDRGPDSDFVYNELLGIPAEEAYLAAKKYMEVNFFFSLLYAMIREVPKNRLYYLMFAEQDKHAETLAQRLVARNGVVDMTIVAAAYQHDFAQYIKDQSTAFLAFHKAVQDMGPACRSRARLLLLEGGFVSDLVSIDERLLVYINEKEKM